MLAGLCPIWFIAPAYARPPTLVREQILPTARPVGARFGDLIELVAVESPGEPVVAGELVMVTLYWQAHARTDANYSVFVHLVGDDGRIAAQVDSYPNGGNYPTSQWETDRVVQDRYVLDTDGLRPGEAFTLKAGVYSHADGRRLPIAGSGGLGERDILTLGHVVVVEA